MGCYIAESKWGDQECVYHDARLKKEPKGDEIKNSRGAKQEGV